MKPARKAAGKPLRPGSRARFLLCSDLDRTLIPNGLQPESPQARPLLRRLVKQAAVCLVYVTGRNQVLVEEAIEQYQLPWPDAVIGDVGTRIWSTLEGKWTEWHQWNQLITRHWPEDAPARIAAEVNRMRSIERQPDDRQTRFKQSYTCGLPDLDEHCARLRGCLLDCGLKVNIIGSIDEVTDQGLIDILPAAATKQSAIDMVMSAWGFHHWDTICAGDSGNDLPFLTSALQAVLVANATDEVRQSAVAMAEQQGQGANLYLARGGFWGMNGNYAAGVLEGMAHYLPHIRNMLK
ncbi:MAG: HAD-IIB family hydrolase [Wenzhouxiangella sp.]|nr:MAG: HAD-IIB family hydrolase [Wenzhouxiangella sp.]